VLSSDELQQTVTTVLTGLELETSFDFLFGFSPQSGLAFPKFVPVLQTEAVVTMSMGAAFDFATRVTPNEIDSLEVAFVLNVPPHTALAAHALVQIGYVEVPYHSTLHRVVPGADGFQRQTSYRVKGVYKGTNVFNVRYIIDTEHHLEDLNPFADDETEDETDFRTDNLGDTPEQQQDEDLNLDIANPDANPNDPAAGNPIVENIGNVL